MYKNLRNDECLTIELRQLTFSRQNCHIHDCGDLRCESLFLEDLSYLRIWEGERRVFSGLLSRLLEL